MADEDEIARRYAAVGADLDERQQRLWAGAEAREIGRGGITVVARATGMSRRRVSKGLSELAVERRLPVGRIRVPGAGRKRVEERDPGLVDELERLVDPVTRGDPESPLRWTAKSAASLARELSQSGRKVGSDTVRRLLRTAGYSLQANAKVREGSKHPDRNAQFEHINAACERFAASGNPAISVDAKKKELVGDFKNAGRELHRRARACTRA